MEASILSIGDELLIGHTVNTNAAWLGVRLGELGIRVARILTIGDDAEEIRSGLEDCVPHYDLTILTGGLGPTHDDITKAVVTEWFGAKLVFHPELLDRLKNWFRTRGMEMPAQNENQAWLPDTAQVLENRVGSAQGMVFEKDGHFCFVLPGVPREMQYIMENDGTAFLKQRLHGPTLLHHTWRTAGVGESRLAEILGDLSVIERYGKLAFLPKFGAVDLRLSITAESPAEARARLLAAEQLVLDKAGKFIYATGTTTLEEAVGKALGHRGETVAVAESCTGGLLARRITSVPGSSAWFPGGIVAYSDAQKTALLGVPEEVLAKHGAVSEETARLLAANIRERMQATYGIGITGIAGPGGGTAEKPVGLVYISLATQESCRVHRFQMSTDRKINQERSAATALLLLHKELHRIP